MNYLICGCWNLCGSKLVRAGICEEQNLNGKHNLWRHEFMGVVISTNVDLVLTSERHSRDHLSTPWFHPPYGPTIITYTNTSLSLISPTNV